MGSESPDAELRHHIIDGLAAATELERRFRKPLERFLASLCDRADGRSLEKIPEVVGHVLERCYGRQPSLLDKWRGEENLNAFLRTVAANDLRTWWKSADHRKSQELGDGASDIPERAGGEDVEEAEISLAVEALHAAIAEAARRTPDGLVLMRLKGLHGVEQRALARCWGHHESRTSRQIKEAMEVIRATAAGYTRERGFDLSPAVWRASLQRDPGMLLKGADTASGLSVEEVAGLEELATRGLAGKHQAKPQRELVELLVARPEALAFFAQRLKRSDENGGPPDSHPALEGAGARLVEFTRRTLERLPPSEALTVIEPEARLFFDDLLRGIKAEGGTLWLLRPGETSLEAVFNPAEPAIIGKRQPLASGLIGLVFATGEPLWSENVPEDSRHSPLIDTALGRETRSMIAVPFSPADRPCGVLTAVRFGAAAPFSQEDAIRFQRGADVFGRLVTHHLWTQALGISTPSDGPPRPPR